ncbi:hypothetical protein C8R48DRAFT_667392 [Suillus tomentosus]|nr:hypothetical protein C8R48DRAFT_667392 [Suillus tomentosus]
MPNLSVTPAHNCHMLVAQPEKASTCLFAAVTDTAITDEIGAVADMLLFTLDAAVKNSSSVRRARFPEKDIEVGGGVGLKTIDVCADAGSNIILAGTAIFNASNPEDVIASLKTTISSLMATVQARFSK